jgi:hypothetical protein
MRVFPQRLRTRVDTYEHAHVGSRSLALEVRMDAGIRWKSLVGLFALLVAACGPGTELPDVGAVDAPGLAVPEIKPSAHVLLTFVRDGVRRTEISAVAFAASPDTGQPFNQLVVVFATPPPCEALRSMRHTVTVGDETITLSPTAARCTPFSGVDRLPMGLPDDFLQRHIGEYATYDMLFVGSTASWHHTFFISGRYENPPSELPVPRITNVLPARNAPGWNGPVSEAESALYVGSEASLTASVPLMPHDEMVWAATVPTPGTAGGETGNPLVAVNIVASPDDLDDGIVIDDAERGQPFGGRPAWLLRTATSRGFVPGERYSIHFVGAAGASDAFGRPVPPTQNANGGGLETWGGDTWSDRAVAEPDKARKPRAA